MIVGRSGGGVRRRQGGRSKSGGTLLSSDVRRANLRLQVSMRRVWSGYGRGKPLPSAVDQGWPSLCATGGDDGRSRRRVAACAAIFCRRICMSVGGMAVSCCRRSSGILKNRAVHRTIYGDGITLNRNRKTWNKVSTVRHGTLYGPLTAVNGVWPLSTCLVAPRGVKYKCKIVVLSTIYCVRTTDGKMRETRLPLWLF